MSLSSKKMLMFILQILVYIIYIYFAIFMTYEKIVTIIVMTTIAIIGSLQFHHKAKSMNADELSRQLNLRIFSLIAFTILLSFLIF
ncbi:hypothetical protein [Apilactobacillus xinyiensis]|uniref:hypothetical protein n=1 Tax=Apilactobacillus xinyiensis TaxID=2841032 RepID=UPI00200FF5BD|nr:hypothetical protein [Apilactobacillus xinyiensis]MCL0330125.1 hypothetical protein [Apilactobacillus xinyiensis]